MTSELSKNVKRMLRDLSGKAYEAELRQALAALSEQFDHWKGGQIDSFELSDEIHKFHQGPSRDLFARYQNGLPEINVAWAVKRGLIPREGLPQTVLDVLDPLLTFYESLDNDKDVDS